MYHVPIVLDGLISGAAALLAKRIIPGTEHFMIASHLGKEPAAKAILKEIGSSQSSMEIWRLAKEQVQLWYFRFLILQCQYIMVIQIFHVWRWHHMNVLVKKERQIK